MMSNKDKEEAMRQKILDQIYALPENEFFNELKNSFIKQLENTIITFRPEDGKFVLTLPKEEEFDATRTNE